MLAAIPLLGFSLVAAFAASYYARRHRRSVAPRPVALHSVATRTAIGRRVPGLTRAGHIGDAAQPDPVRSMISIAAPAEAGSALDVTLTDGTVLEHVPASDVVMARGWSRGHLVVAFGETRREYGPSWALGPAMAGWEVHLVTTNGRVLRCYGPPASVADEDLARLRERIQSAVLAQAS
jgi:hypothetical protein